jgi:hypothetical protein
MARPRKPPGWLPESAQRALKIEVNYVDLNLPTLFTRPAKFIANKVGVSERAVRGWRAKPSYREEAIRLLAERRSSQYHEPNKQKPGDPPEGTIRDGMIFADGCWQELKNKHDADRVDELFYRSPSLRRKQAAYLSHKAKKERSGS